VQLRAVARALIRRPPDRSLSPAPRSVSSVTTSFFASECQGIPHKLFPNWVEVHTNSVRTRDNCTTDDVVTV